MFRPPPPQKKKSKHPPGVLKMIDTLSSDIEKEMAVAKTEEADAQSDYEETIKALENGCNGRKGKKSRKIGGSSHSPFGKLT